MNPTVGLLYAGNTSDPRAWSGIPAGLARGLESLDVGVVNVRAELPPPLATLVQNGLGVLRALRTPASTLKDPLGSLRNARRLARASPAVARLRTRAVNEHLRGAPHLDALVQVHAEFRPEATKAPLATYEDLTVVQALQNGYTELVGLSPREQQQRIAIQRGVYERARACCTTTWWAKNSIVDDYGISPRKVHVVGIATDRQATASGNPERDWSVPRFLFVGWDWGRKNGDGLLRAFATVREKFASAEMHLVGGHPKVTADGVITHGPLRLDVPSERRLVDDLYRRATCYAMPSRMEPSAIAYVEAATFGLPSIGTSAGGSAELIGEGGLVVDPADHDALCRAMLEMCEPTRAAELGARALSRSTLYTWPAVASRILTALGVEGFDEPDLSAGA